MAASEYASTLQHIPQFSKLGPVFKSAEPLLLTEEETEYNIAVVVHVLETHVLLQFNCTNTVAEQVLENVNVVVDLTEAVSVTPLQKFAAAAVVSSLLTGSSCVPAFPGLDGVHLTCILHGDAEGN